ncbi:MAG: hypothetical protein U0353_30765 [Sandaracinus sp.]
MSRRTLDTALVPALLLAVGLVGCPDTHDTMDAGHADVGTDAFVTNADCACGQDAPFGLDAWALPASCNPQVAEIDVCAAVCDDVDGAFWDGTRCIATSCNCTGSDCGTYATVEACQAAHAHCDAALCLATGGRYFSRPQFCGHFECGFPPAVACDEPLPACDCGLYNIFVDGVGCMPGPLCELIAPMEPQALCESTHGTWHTDMCGSTTCGRVSDTDCIAPGCACGTYEIFDAERGCIQSPECDVRLLGEDCTATQRCGGGSVCCVSGGASTAAACEAPMCSDPSGVCGPPRP